MKKIKAILGILLLFIIMYFLQTNFFNFFTIAGIQPNLFILLITFLGLYVNKRLILLLSTILGLILDLLNGNAIGITSILFIIAGLAISSLEKYFSKDSKLTIILIIMGTTLIFESIYYIFQYIRFEIVIEILTFLKICSIEVIYNAILTILLYPLWQKIGPIIEESLKQEKRLTHYL